MSKNQKTLTKKAANIIKSNLVMSVAVTSVALNLFFILGVVIYSSTPALDEQVYATAYHNLCVENYYDNLAERMEDGENAAYEAAIFDAYCGTGDFEKYKEAAVKAYLYDAGYAYPQE